MKQLESIFWGIIAAISALFLEVLISTMVPILSGPEKELATNFSSPISFILIVSILTEETFKYLVIFNRIEKFSYGRMLIINSFWVGLGFSLVELTLIYGKFSVNLNMTFELKEIIGLILIHILTAGIIGYFTAVHKIRKHITFIKAIVAASTIHFFYDALIIWKNEFTDLLIFSFLAITIALIALSIININKKLAT